jgi:hypothetical protein
MASTEVEHVVTLNLNDVPPSLNRIGMRGSHWATTEKKKQWQHDLGFMLMAEKLPRGLERVTATASLRFPKANRRDEGNFSWLLEKALGDALQEGGWLQDDTPDQYRFRGLVFEAERGPKRTLVTVAGIKVVHAA